MTSRFFINVYKDGDSKSVFRGYFDVNNTTDVIEHFYDSIAPAIDIIMTGTPYSTNKFKDGKFTGNGSTITSMPSVDAEYNSLGWHFQPELWHQLKNVMGMKYSWGWNWTPSFLPLLQYKIEVCTCTTFHSVGISQKSTGVELSIVNISLEEDEFVDAENIALDIIANDNPIIPNGVIYNKTHRLITDFNIANIPALDALNGSTEWNIIWKNDHGSLKLLSSNVFTSPPPVLDDLMEIRRG
jgi:hypothetical protein